MAATIETVTFDCADAARMAAFWSQVLEHPVDEGASADFAAIGVSDDNKLRPAMMFLKVPEAKAAKNRCHPDLVAVDLDAEAARVAALGARRVGAFDEAGFRWVSFTDPEGNEFDIASAG